MPNRAYANIWLNNFDETNMLAQFGRFLASVPLSAGPLGFSDLTIRAVDSTETPVEEFDLRGQAMTAAEIAVLAAEHQASDMGYEVSARWDMWIREMETASWKMKPEMLNLFCHGPQYDSDVAAESGHFLADLGFEHLFTGHAGLLTPDSTRVAQPQHPDEARFLMWMSQPHNLRDYQEKTRENIEKLMAWMGAVDKALAVQRVRLWSEGEENFEARLDEILAVR